MKKVFTAERVEELRQLARAPDIYDRLARALGMKPTLFSSVVQVSPLKLGYPSQNLVRVNLHSSLGYSLVPLSR